MLYVVMYKGPLVHASPLVIVLVDASGWSKTPPTKSASRL